MNTLKRIIINLILVLALTILTSGVVQAAGLDSVSIRVVDNEVILNLGKALSEFEPIDDEGTILQIYSNGNYVGYIFGMGNGKNGDWGPYSLCTPDGGMVGFDYINKNETTISLVSIVDSDAEVIGIKGANGAEKKFNNAVTGDTPEVPDAEEVYNFNYNSINANVAGNAENGFKINLSHSLGTLKNNGCKQITINEVSGAASITILLQGESISGTNQSYSNSLTSINIGNVYGTYRITFYDSNGIAKREISLSTIGEAAFNASLRSEGFKYYLVFTESKSTLLNANAGNHFQVYFTSLGKSVSSSSMSGNEIPIPSGWNLHEYAGQTLAAKITSGNTGLSKNLSLYVPEPPEASDFSAEITSVGTITFKSNTGSSSVIDDLQKSLGISSSTKFNLYYAGAVQPTGSTGEGASSSSITYSDFLSLSNNIQGIEITEEGSYGSFSWVPEKLKAYFKAVAENGDLTLRIEVGGHTIAIEHPSGTTYFEKITGLSLEELGIITEGMQDFEEGNSVQVTDYTLIVPAKDYVDFMLPSSGVYHPYQKVEAGLGYGSTVTIYPSGGHATKPLAKAGRLTGEVKDDKPVGEYIYYSMEAKMATYGEDYGRANCYPLLAGTRYRVDNSTNVPLTVVFHPVGGELVEISDENLGEQVILQSEIGTQIQVGYILIPEYDFFKSLEEMLAWFVRSLANGLTYLVHMSLQAVSGGDTAAVDIDSILFNHYPDTIVNFFDNAKSNTDAASQIVERFRDGINRWYDVFKAIAVAGYLVILLYLGVKILLKTSGKSQAQYKELFMYWIVGVVILTFFPYVIKYAIDLNNFIVQMIEDSKTEVLNVSNYRASVDMSDFSLPIIMLDEEEYKGFAAMMDKNPYAGSNSYMALMASRAESSERLVDAVVYLIMVWQFIMIVIIYYKRVFMIAFLIVIFPWVALSYAIDKIGDGKSQAFNTWTKEIMANIFVQSIHALVYVFVIGATYTSGTYSGDWLLTIMGISFLFQGEQILKKIIGLNGDSATSLADTAKRTIATVTAAKVVTKNVADNVVGAKSHLGRTVQYYRQYQTEKKTVRNMDFLTNKKEIPKGRELFKDEQGNDISNQFNDEEYHELADAIQVLNHQEAVTDPRVLAEALDTVMKNKGSLDSRTQSLMKGLNLSDEQLQEMSDLQQEVVDKLVDGDKSTDQKYAELKESIDQDIELRLQAIFPADRERRALLKRALYYRMRDGNKDEKHKIRSTDRLDVKREMDEARDRRNSFLDPDVLSREGDFNPFSDQAKPSRLSDSAEHMRTSILSTHYKVKDGKYGREDTEMARNLAILKDFSNQGTDEGNGGGHAYTPEQTWKAVKYVAEHQKDSKENKMAVKATLGIDGEDAKAIIAEEIGRRYTDVTGDRRQFREEIENGPRINPIASTEMEKKVATASTKNVWEEVIEYITEHDKKAGERLCYDESLDKISVRDALRRERMVKPSEDEKRAFDEAYADYIVSERMAKNEEEINWVENFAREQLDDTPEVSGATYNGLTKEEHQKYSKDLKKKFAEELTRTASTTTGVVLGAAIGTGLEIGLSDDKPILEEALIGASAGALIGDSLAENALGRENKTKTVEIVNPYTGKPEKVDLRRNGALAEGWGIDLIRENEVITLDDPRIAGGFKYDIERKFLETKQKQEKKIDFERRRNLYDDALRRKMDSDKS